MKERLLNMKSNFEIKAVNAIIAKKKGMDTYIAVLIVALIAVIVGAVLMGVMKTAFPELFNDIIDKIKSTFTL